MMKRNRLVEAKYGIVHSEDGWNVVVELGFGKPVRAHPHTTPHYHVIAHRCGYGDDIASYCFEHEFFHLMVAEFFYDRPSEVLRALALERPLSGAEAAYEEMMAQAAQRFVRANERPIIGGVDWDAFRAKALQRLEFV